MTKNLIIIGTGMLAEVAISYFKEYTNYSIKGVACHKEYKKSDNIFNLDLLDIDTLNETHSPKDYLIFIAIGYNKMNKVREKIYMELKNKGYKFATFIHPDVKIWDSTKIGENVLILENNTIQPFTSIGNNTIIWSGNHFGHHGKIGDHCFISSHVVISGYCDINDNVFIGVNSTIKDGIKISEATLIGAGSLVMKNTIKKEVLIAQRTKPFIKNSDQITF